MKIALLSIASILVMAASCGSTKETASTDQNQSSTAALQSEEATAVTSASEVKPATQTPQNQQMNQQKENEKYRMIVSFISIGEGTDLKAKDIMDGVISKWETRSGKKIEIENHPWGREGEVDFCFNLKELSPQDQALFARDMREALKSHQLIQISEFQPSMHKR